MCFLFGVIFTAFLCLYSRENVGDIKRTHRHGHESIVQTVGILFFLTKLFAHRTDAKSKFHIQIITLIKKMVDSKRLDYRQASFLTCKLVPPEIVLLCLQMGWRRIKARSESFKYVRYNGSG